MSAKSLSRRALKLAGARAPRTATQGTPLPVSTPAPVAQGRDDSVIIFRSWLLRTQGDGCELRAALDRMVARAPKIADQVIFAGSLGEVSQGRAADSLRTYLATGVAQAPMGL